MEETIRFVHMISDALRLRKQIYILSRYRERNTVPSLAREARGLHLPERSTLNNKWW